MAIELAEAETPASPGQFTQAQVDGIAPLLQRIAGGTFSYLIAGNNAPRLDDCNGTNDAISIGAYSIVRSVEAVECESIVGTSTHLQVAYQVYVTVETSRQTYWQPADYDEQELGKVYSLNDAVVAIIAAEITQAVRNYEEELSYRRDHEEPEHPGGTSA